MKLQKLVIENINDILWKWINHSIKPWDQKGKTSYCFRKDISKEKAQIDWNKSAEEIERMIRAFNPKPVAWTTIKVRNKFLRLKIYDACIGDDVKGESVKGTHIESEKLYIQTKNGSIMPRIVQLEGKNKMGISSFLNGFKTNLKIN